MVLGLSIQAFTIVHVVISLVAIASGFVVLFGMLRSQRMQSWTALFLLTTALTSVTGFFFPIRDSPRRSVSASFHACCWRPQSLDFMANTLSVAGAGSMSPVL
ncbi:MAG: hypothetical protein WA723_05955 [Pseudolabrys sp.]